MEEEFEELKSILESNSFRVSEEGGLVKISYVFEGELMNTILSCAKSNFNYEFLKKHIDREMTERYTVIYMPVLSTLFNAAYRRRKIDRLGF